MMFSQGHAAKFVLLAAGQAIRASAECAYRVGELWFGKLAKQISKLIGKSASLSLSLQSHLEFLPYLFALAEMSGSAPRLTLTAVAWSREMQLGFSLRYCKERAPKVRHTYLTVRRPVPSFSVLSCGIFCCRLFPFRVVHAQHFGSGHAGRASRGSRRRIQGHQSEQPSPLRWWVNRSQMRSSYRLLQQEKGEVVLFL